MEAPKIVHKEGPIPVIIEDNDEEGERSSTPFLKSSLCNRCFDLPCFRHRRRSGAVGSPSPSSSSSSSFWERLGSSKYDDRWWAPGLRVIKKIREWSEVIAGPKWKTFIRKLGRKGNRTAAGGGSGGVGRGGGKFNYDLVNYSLNFDEGGGNLGGFYDDDEFRRLRSFSVKNDRGGETVVPGAEGARTAKDAVVFAA